MSDLRRLGKNIEILIKRQDKTIKDLAGILKCSGKRTKRILQGESRMTFSQLDNVTSWLDVSIVSLFNDAV